MSQIISTKNYSKIVARHSFYEPKSPQELVPSTSETSRSDINIIRSKDFPSIIDSGCVNRYGLPVREASSEEYYKRYEHDDVPVKDRSCGDNELTNSDLDKMEIRIYRNISKKLQTNESSTDENGLESNIKLFKTTVQEIFDNFNNNMRDFELYKKKYETFLSQNKENSVKEMEDFIKEMIKHIISSESCNTSASNETNFKTISKIGGAESNTFTLNSEDHEIKMQNVTEAYKNENYLTDSTFEKESSKTNCTEKSEHRDKTYNIYLMGGDRCVEIKMDGRNLLSEINIRNQLTEEADQVASAENIKSVAAKKLQLQKYMTHGVECKSNDEIIPVKVSYAKKNIHSEDCSDTTEESNQFFIFKICKYICKKLRKS